MSTVPHPAAPSFALGTRDDEATLAARFAATGIVSIPGILADQIATELHAMLRRREDWRQVIGGDEKLVELDRPTRAGLSEEQRHSVTEVTRAAPYRRYALTGWLRY